MPLPGRFALQRNEAAAGIEHGDCEGLQTQATRVLNGAQDKSHKRGALVLDGVGEQSRKQRNNQQPSFAGVPLQPQDETKHFKLIGQNCTPIHI